MVDAVTIALILGLSVFLVIIGFSIKLFDDLKFDDVFKNFREK